MSKTKFWLISKTIQGDEFADPMTAQDLQTAILDAKYKLASIPMEDRKFLEWAVLADAESLTEAHYTFGVWRVNE